MKKLKFGIDVDGVLRDTMRAILKIYNSKFGKSMTLDDFTEYDVQKQFPEIPNAAKYFFSGDIGKYILTKTSPIQGALDAFKVLSEIGTVYIVTSQHGYDNVRDTLYWLFSNGFDTDQLCFVHDKSLISGLDYFIDDNPEKFTGSDSKNCILIDMPYNRYDLGPIIESTSCKSIERYLSLEDFVNKRILNKE